MSNILLRKTDVLKTFRKRTFLGKKIWRNVLALKSKKVQDIFRKTFIFGIVVFILSSAVFCLQNCLRFLLICFAWDIKGFYPSSLGNEVDSKDMSNVSPNILAKNWNFKKLRHGRWKSNDNNNINIFLSLENRYNFLLSKKLAKEKTWKGIFNANSELSQNLTEKQILPSKPTINGLFNYMWCYLVIACFDWKIGIFQQTVVKVYYILNGRFFLNRFPVYFNLFILLFYVTPCLIVTVQPCMEWISIKKQ